MNDPVVVEPVPISDVFVTGIARIEIIGHNARFYLYTDQNSFDAGRPPDRFIVAKIIIPLENLPEAIRKAMTVTVGEVYEGVTGKLRELLSVH